MITLAIIIFGLTFFGLYLILQGSLMRMVIGILLLGNAANLIIFRYSGTTRVGLPIISPSESTLSGEYSDPLPQALILTAIVISFGLAVYLSFLALRAYEEHGSDRIDALEESER